MPHLGHGGSLVWRSTAIARKPSWRREGGNLPETGRTFSRFRGLVWRPPPDIGCRSTNGRQAVALRANLLAVRRHPCHRVTPALVRVSTPTPNMRANPARFNPAAFARARFGYVPGSMSPRNFPETPIGPDFVAFFEKWQTLAAGFLAILAAVVGGYFVMRQVWQADAHEGDRRQRRRTALRAVMPLSLSALIEYARSSGDALREYHRLCTGGALPIPVAAPGRPELPVEAISTVRDFAEHASEAEAKFLAGLLSEIQVQSSRLRDLENTSARRDAEEVVLTINIEEYIIDSASIYAMASAMFDYARFRTEVFPTLPDAAALHSALRQMRFWDEAFPQVHATVERRGGLKRFGDHP